MTRALAIVFALVLSACSKDTLYVSPTLADEQPAIVEALEQAAADWCQRGYCTEIVIGYGTPRADIFDVSRENNDGAEYAFTSGCNPAGPHCLIGFARKQRRSGLPIRWYLDADECEAARDAEPDAAKYVNALSVARHELGHFWGFGHDDSDWWGVMHSGSNCRELRRFPE